METENFSEKDSLRLINEMISKAKKSYVTKGIAPMVWGSIIFFCSMVTWAKVHFKFETVDVWLLTFIALGVQIFYGIKEGRNKKFTSYESIIISYVWTAFGISMFVTSFFVGKLAANIETTSLFMMLYAIPTFITGGVTKFKPMIYGGVFCWVASVVSIFTNFEIDTLLMAACGLFAWLIPGIILWKRYKKTLATHV